LSCAIGRTFAFCRRPCNGWGRTRQAAEGAMADAVLEEKVAHLMRAVDDLSDVVAGQAKEIERLSRLVQLLVEREAEREAMAVDGPAANVRPPHW